MKYNPSPTGLRDYLINWVRSGGDLFKTVVKDIENISPTLENDDEFCSAMIDHCELHPLHESWYSSYTPSNTQLIKVIHNSNVGNRQFTPTHPLYRLLSTYPITPEIFIELINHLFPNDTTTQLLISIAGRTQLTEQCLIEVCGIEYRHERSPTKGVKDGLLGELLKQIPLSAETLLTACNIEDEELVMMHDPTLADERHLAAAVGSETLLQYFLKYVKPTQLVFDTAFESSNVEPFEIIKQIYGEKYSSSTLTTLISQHQIQLNKFKLVLQHVQPDQSHLELACGYRHFQYVQLLLNYKLTITQECFDDMFLYKSYSRKDAKQIADQIDVFINNGYLMTYDTVVALMKYGHYVNDIERFNFRFTDEFTRICAVSGWYPYSIPYNIESLTIACIKGDTKIITEHLESGVVPDKTCWYVLINKEELCELLLQYSEPDPSVAMILGNMSKSSAIRKRFR